MNSSSVAIAEAVEEITATAVENDEHRKPVETPCVLARSVTLSPVSETLVQVKTSAGAIILRRTHKIFAGGHQAQVAQGNVYSAPRIPFDNKVANVSNSFIQLPKGMTVGKCSSVPPMWYEPTMEENEINNATAVQLYKASKSEKEIMNERYDTAKQDASLQERH